jgi:probable phosphoglycerate mutase
MSLTPTPQAALSAIERLKQIAAAHPIEVTSERFYFLRHGQTARNAARIFQGPDEPLDETGLKQAGQAAQLLSGVTLSSIVCSNMCRALQTTQIVAAHHGVAAVERAGLRERNFGALIGTSSAAIDWNCAPAGGETLEDFVQRARAGLAEALSHPAPVLVVAHGGTLYVLAGLLRVNLTLPLLGNAQPLCFTRDERRWRVAPLGNATESEPDNLA